MRPPRTILFILISVFAVILIIGLFILFSFLQDQKQNTLNTNPTPGSQNGSQLNRLQLTSTTPANNAVNVSPSTRISLQFNKSINTLTPSILLSPEVPFDLSVSGNTLSIQPSIALLPGTTYTTTTTLSGQTFFVSFTTTGPTPTLGPDTRPVDQIDEEQKLLRANNPDIYLSNKTPYSNSEISVTSAFNEATGQFQFIVTAKQGQEAATTSFTKWAKQQGLTDEQIGSLETVYH